MNLNQRSLIFVGIVIAILAGIFFLGKSSPVNGVSLYQPNANANANANANRMNANANANRMNAKANANRMNANRMNANGGGIVGMDIDADQYAPIMANGNANSMVKNIGCSMNAGVGLASSLLPREIASQEDFGQFVPEDILKGQSFLDPRQQVGMPETVGGNLRNANQSIRAEPPNPKKPYVWQNSTIVPDMMQRPLN